MINAKTSLTIHGKSSRHGSVLVTGTLRSKVSSCIKHKAIRLYRVRKRKGPRLLAQTRTGRRGGYSFRLLPTNSETLRTNFPGSFTSSYGGEQVCRASWSKKLRVIVRHG